MKNEQFFIKVKANLTSKMEDIQMPFSQNLNLPNDYESKQINAINWLLHTDFSRLPETQHGLSNVAIKAQTKSCH